MAVNNQILQKMVEQANQKAPKSNASAVMAAVLLTALVIGGGVWAYDNFMVIKVKDQALTEANNKTAELDNQNKNLAQQLNDLNQAKEEEAKKMLLYSNAQYGYSLSYPINYTMLDKSVIADKTSIHQILFTGQDANSVMVRVKTEKEISAYMDQEPSSTIYVAGMMANKYVFSNGICDGPGCSLPVVVVKVYRDGKSYILEFYNVTDIMDQNLEILNSFQFNN